ncbi:hypothetical protein [Lacinutrix salivirga]
MKLKLYITILVFVIISCKNEAKPKAPQTEGHTIESTITSENPTKTTDSITVYNSNYLATKTVIESNNLALITQGLIKEFTDYPFTNDPNQLSDTKEIYDEKLFLESLAEDFKNKDFLEVSSINYAFVLPKENTNSSYISIEEWHFKTPQQAESAFESLKNFKETEIHFKTINWIWVHQKDKLFLIYSTDYKVSNPIMQTIKQQIIDVVAVSGAYKTIQFYE